MTVFLSLFFAFGLAIFFFGLQTLFFYPLSLYYEVWKKRFFRKHRDPSFFPLVSVLIPAYNEESTIRMCVESVLSSDYPSFEVIVIDDGSTDRTAERIRDYVASGKIRYIWKPNGGKASALNRGIQEAQGEIIVYTDADSLFRPDTLQKLVRWFVSPRIDAVCGNDTPIHPTSALQKLLTITTHIGTGFVRRALSVLNVLPIISGNSGAVRKDLLEKVGGFTEIWGEDLDLTFKLHKARARIVFDPEALVISETPKNLSTLWKQRVRWMRSFLKICGLHKDLFFNPRYFPFSFYLPINWVNMVVVPVFQLMAFVLLPLAIHLGVYRWGGLVDVIAYLGFGLFLVVSVYSTLLDRAFGHLKYIPLYGWLMIPLSYFYNAVLVYSIYKEIRGAEERWEKITRRELEQLGETRAIPFWHRRWTWAIGGTTVLFLFLALGLMLRRHHSAVALPPSGAQVPPVFAIATHFDAWPDPEQAIQSVLKRPYQEIINMVGVSAGRYEWNNFRWKGHEQTWSNDQKAAPYDLLTHAIQKFQAQGKKVVAIVDFYAPAYLKEHPEDAAVGVDGRVSTEQVCFTELVRGKYGRLLVEMITYLAKHYDLKAISLTELEYHRFCYDERCLKLFQERTGERGWPRTFFPRRIDKDHPKIARWRSQLMYEYLREIADSVHKYGKDLYVDVPVDWKRMDHEGIETGLYYPWVLRVADAIIVWDYFYLENRPPETSEEVARFFTERYGATRVILSLGLWGKSHPVSPEELATALYHSLQGGAQKLWITPNHLLTPQHWQRVLEVLGVLKPKEAMELHPQRVEDFGNVRGTIPHRFRIG